MDDTPSNTVRLTRENIDLRRKLDEAEELIDALKLKLSQQARHVYSHEVRNAPSSLAELLGGGKAAPSSVTGHNASASSPPGGGAVSGGVSACEYDALEAELEESRQREETLRKELEHLQQKQVGASNACASSATHTPPRADDSAELQSARKRIEALENSEKKLRAALDDLNSALEVNATLPPCNPSSTRVEDACGGERAENLADQLLAEQAAQALLAEELEETKFLMEQERADFERRMNEAQSEKNIAVRVKNEALKEAASARTESSRLRAELSKLSSTPQHHTNAPAAGEMTHDAQLLRDQVTFLETRLETMQRQLSTAEKDAARAHKAGKRAFLERQSALKDLEAWKLKQIQAAKSKVSASAAAVAALSASTGTGKGGDHHLHVETCVESAAQKLGLIQERLLVALSQKTSLMSSSSSSHHGSSKTEEHHHHHVTNINYHHITDETALRSRQTGQAGSLSAQAAQGSAYQHVGDEDDPSMTGAVMDASSLQTVEEWFMGGDDWAHLVCEEFFAYERQIHNLKSEVLSLQTIAKLSDDESAAHWTRKIRAMQDEMDVLRSAAQEYREAASAKKHQHTSPQQQQASSYYTSNHQSPQQPPIVGRVVPNQNTTGAPVAIAPVAGFYHQQQPSYSTQGTAFNPSR